jgi:hypothetical protein
LGARAPAAVRIRGGDAGELVDFDEAFDRVCEKLTRMNPSRR